MRITLIVVVCAALAACTAAEQLKSEFFQFAHVFNDTVAEGSSGRTNSLEVTQASPTSVWAGASISREIDDVTFTFQVFLTPPDGEAEERFSGELDGTKASVTFPPTNLDNTGNLLGQWSVFLGWDGEIDASSDDPFVFVLYTSLVSGSVDATANETLSLNVVQPGAVLIIPPVAREGAITFQLAAERNGEATDPSDGVSTIEYLSYCADGEEADDDEDSGLCQVDSAEVENNDAALYSFAMSPLVTYFVRLESDMEWTDFDPEAVPAITIELTTTVTDEVLSTSSSGGGGGSDLTWLWVILGILAGLVGIGGLAALAYGGFVMYSRSKHNREIYDTV